VFIPIRDENPLRAIRYQWITTGLIAINVIVYVLEATVIGQQAAISFAVVPGELFQVGLFGGAAHGPTESLAVPEGLTLFTYMFLHSDILHLTTNMLFLWVFGDNVEDAMGHAWYLAFYLVCGVVGGALHAIMLPDSKLPLIGASGAVAGVIAAYLMLHPRVRVWILVFRVVPLRITAAVALGAWIASQFLMLLVPQTGHIAWWAHIGGIGAGAFLVLFLRRPGVPLFDRGLSGGERVIP
jgi:membrane associated rhomboid family serine protease